MMNSQETYDHVKNHLLTQNREARLYGSCAYRSADGLKCAIGCLIPDDKYDPAFEGMLWSSNVTLRKLVESVTSASARLLTELQDLHDWTDTFNWKSGLFAIAKKHGPTP